MTIVEICVHMDCQGCERKIRKALQKVKGVEEVQIDMEKQKVTVTGWVDQNKVLKAVQKTGRKAVFWPYGYSNGGPHTGQKYYYQQYHPALAQNYTSYGADNYPSSTPSYNYYRHGYGGGYENSRVYGNFRYPYPPQPTPVMYPARVGQRAEDMFSEENPNACSIM